jgi:glycosyltransferase involved in cell wall biosynthesis
MGLSVIIITLNEEDNIARAIKSVAFADEIIVLDSNSIDKTVQIASGLGATVFCESFQGYGQQKNLALSKCNHEWVFWLDADEEVDPALAEQMKKVLATPNSPYDFYEINRKTRFINKWIEHGGWYPDKIVRLFRKNLAKFTEPEVHEELVTLSGEKPASQQLSGNLLHYSFPTVESQIATNFKYSALGAHHLLSQQKDGPSLFSLLLKPFGKFLECFFWKRGFLDGIQGFIIAVNASVSIFQKYSIAYMRKYENR